MLAVPGSIRESPSGTPYFAGAGRATWCLQNRPRGRSSRSRRNRHPRWRVDRGLVPVAAPRRAHGGSDRLGAGGRGRRSRWATGRRGRSPGRRVLGVWCVAGRHPQPGRRRDAAGALVRRAVGRRRRPRRAGLGGGAAARRRLTDRLRRRSRSRRNLGRRTWAWTFRVRWTLVVGGRRPGPDPHRRVARGTDHPRLGDAPSAAGLSESRSARPRTAPGAGRHRTAGVGQERAARRRGSRRLPDGRTGGAGPCVGPPRGGPRGRPAWAAVGRHRHRGAHRRPGRAHGPQRRHHHSAARRRHLSRDCDFRRQYRDSGRPTAAPVAAPGGARVKSPSGSSCPW